MIYYERYLGDYSRDTTMLSMLEEGAYTRLIDFYYSTEKPLPLDENEVCKIARARSGNEKKSTLNVLHRFFQKTDSGFVQKRIEQEIGRFKVKQSKARKAADTRWKTARDDADASPESCASNADASAEHRSSNAIHHQSSAKAVNLKPKTLKPLSSISSPGRARALARIRAHESGDAAERRDENALTDDSSSNPLALREAMRSHGLKLTPKIENGIDAASREGVTLATLERALLDAQARQDVTAPALYALKTARQWTAQHPDARPLPNSHGATLTPAQQYGAKLERTARTLTTVSHEVEPATVEGAITEVSHVAEKRRS